MTAAPEAPAPPPPPPREPRWRTSTGYRRTLGQVGTIGTVVATVVLGLAWARAGFDLPFEDRLLDDLAATQDLGSADAVVTEITPTGVQLGGTTLVRVDYDWRLDTQPRRGTGFAAEGRFAIGQAYALEYLPSDPTVQRLSGATRARTSHLSGWVLVLWGVPFALLLWWLRGVFKLRSVLRDGPVTTAEVVQHRGRNGAVAYRFVDDQGVERRGTQTVGPRDPLGRDLREGRSTVDVVYDPLRGVPHRIVTAADFH